MRSGATAASETREADLDNREMWIRERERATGEHEIVLTQREEVVRLREAATVARSAVEQARYDRDRMMDQMRAANEQLVLATLRADIAAAEAIAARIAATESETQFQTLANTVPSLAWSADAGGDVHWFNDRWYEYTGATFETLIGWRWEGTIDPAEHARVTAKWRASLASGEPWEDTFRVRRHDGAFRAFLSRALPFRDASGRIVRWFGTSVDIDDKRRAEIAAQDSERAKDDFLAMLGHELRNPLAPILTALELMTLRDASAFPRERKIIERQVKHLERLVDDLLDVSRITRGKLELTRAPIELAALVARAVELVSPLLEGKSHHLSVDVPTEGLRVDADAIRMTQVIGNLLTNAAKYTPAHGAISITGTRVGHDVTLSVRDNGIGISADMLGRVFDMFTQERQALDRARGGLGLGLAIATSIAVMHGGTVSATSDGVGRGSEFTLRLPGASSSRPAIAESIERAPSPRPRKVLVVDDNPDVAELTAELLRAFGHDICVAHDGPSALAAVRTFAADVALLDIGLPGMDGYELAGTLREVIPMIRLVAITGYGQAADRLRTSAAGFSAHLTKPVNANTLQASILDDRQVIDARPSS